MDPIDKLARLLNELPGIGPRQSKRLAYALIVKSKSYTDELSKAIREVRDEVTQCSSCHRYISAKHLSQGLCSICRDMDRDRSLLMIIPRDVDMQNMERSGVYHGLYFVLGGTVPILEKDHQAFIRKAELERLLRSRAEIKEIILAYSQTPEGEHTAFLLKELIPTLGTFAISELGRGLSTGTELEYSDNETLRNALRNRG